jgi:hypothetical protein
MLCFWYLPGLNQNAQSFVSKWVSKVRVGTMTLG